MSFICHIHNYTEYNEEWNVFSAFNPSKCTQTWSSGQPTLRHPGSSRGFGALLKGLTSVVARAEIQTHYFRLQVRRSIHLATTAPSSLHLTHPKRRRTRSSGQPCYGARGAVRGSVPCSRALQSWYWTQFLPARDSNLQTLGYKPDSLTIRPRLPLHGLLWNAKESLFWSTQIPSNSAYAHSIGLLVV